MNNLDFVAAPEQAEAPSDGAVTQKPLFQLGSFMLNSGAKSFWKIDADALTVEDIECLARLALDRVPPFGKVVGVPRGGLRLAAALEPYCRPHCTRVLIVDDVLTSGGSMRRKQGEVAREYRCTSDQIYGLVIFARAPIAQDWIRALFQLSSDTYS